MIRVSRTKKRKTRIVQRGNHDLSMREEKGGGRKQ